MMIKEALNTSIKDALAGLGIEVEPSDIELEHPTELAHGDFASNVAMRFAQELDTNPRELAEKIQQSLDAARDDLGFVDKIEIAGPGFINFFLSRNFFTKSLDDIAAHGAAFGSSESLEGKRVMVEYTDPNLFKEFHVGHIMNNTLGEAIANLYESRGASVARANYQSDIGPPVAKAIWGMRQLAHKMPPDDAPLYDKVRFLGDSYVTGSAAYEEGSAKTEIDDINTAIYERSNDALNELYTWGRTVSLNHFEEIYKKLGTRFDYYFFESQVFEDGLKLVEEGKQKGVFEESEGAVVYHGEQDGLHTRVFVNARGLPTYETKELGLTKQKFETEAFDQSIVVTGNEQTSYFQVVMAALDKLRPEWVAKTKHIEHGMLRTPEGKMSSRKGNVIGGGTLIEDVEERAREKIAESERELDDPEKLATQEAVAAIKYAILRQTPGKNVVFDIDQSLSLEGDSGPYLQYTHTRCVSVLEKAEREGVTPSIEKAPADPFELERVLYRFPEVVERAFAD
ncbi:MAG: arginine--tRNA ligase, partial [Candidatus Paceibacterota bacterium]